MFDEDVMLLATGNFEREIKRAYMIFVLFYKDKCQKCTKVRRREWCVHSYVYKELKMFEIEFSFSRGCLK